MVEYNPYLVAGGLIAGALALSVVVPLVREMAFYRRVARSTYDCILLTAIEDYESAVALYRAVPMEVSPDWVGIYLDRLTGPSNEKYVSPTLVERAQACIAELKGIEEKLAA